MKSAKMLFLLMVLCGFELAQGSCLPKGKADIPRENSVSLTDIYLMDMTKCDLSELELANSNLEYYAWSVRNIINGNNVYLKKLSRKERDALRPNLTEANATLSLVKLEIQKRTGEIPKNFGELFP